MTTGRNEIPDWIESLSRLAGSVGLNAVRTRWKLVAWREQWYTFFEQGRDKSRHVQYKHRVCGTCGALLDKNTKTCTQCGNSLVPRWVEVLGRVALMSPGTSSISSLLAAACLLAYVRVALAGGQILSFDSQVLFAFGGNFPPAVWQGGEWWRTATYIFLHAGAIHIAFNLVALMQIGPALENIFGRGRMLFVFMVTGIFAGVASSYLRPFGVGIGASGSLMGLVGLAAGWGHRDGTSHGREIRNMMIKWGAYTVVFGLFIGADNTAHIAGFIAGVGLGLIYKPLEPWSGRAPGTWRMAETLIGWGLALATFLRVMLPPS